jgi:hypothetical protein
LAAVTALFSGAAANAVIFNSSTINVSSDAFNNTVGNSFTATSGFTVTALGAFDAGKDGITTATVRLWQQTGPGTWNSAAGAQLTGTTQPLQTPSGGGAGLSFRWNSTFTPVTVPAGNYILSGMYNPNTKQIGNSALGDPAPVLNLLPGWTYTGDKNGAGAPLDQVPLTPVTGFAGGPPYFSAGNMEFVPEPSTYALVTGLGLVGFGLYRRRQSK